MKEKAIFNWSGGKDSALCLHKILQEDQFEIYTLLTTVNATYQRIAMHGVRLELLDMQANRLNLPLKKMEMPEMPTMEAYDAAMKNILTGLKTYGVTASIFGDIFLEDLRNYREQKLAEVSMRGIFPLWKIPSGQLVQEFIDLGFKTVVTCVNEKYLDKSFAGRLIDETFLNDLPVNVDPCGENGEFHSFVYDGPIFSHPIDIKKGDLVYRKYEAMNADSDENSNGADSPYANGFWYCDLLPA